MLLPEIRFIAFDQIALKEALIEMDKVKSFPGPPIVGIQTQIICKPTHPDNLMDIDVFLSSQPQKPLATIKYVYLMEALIRHCIAKRIPLPKDSQKALAHNEHHFYLCVGMNMSSDMLAKSMDAFATNAPENYRQENNAEKAATPKSEVSA
jgi:hypothetical protein